MQALQDLSGLASTGSPSDLAGPGSGHGYGSNLTEPETRLQPSPTIWRDPDEPDPKLAAATQLSLSAMSDGEDSATEAQHVAGNNTGRATSLP